MEKSIMKTIRKGILLLLCSLFITACGGKPVETHSSEASSKIEENDSKEISEKEEIPEKKESEENLDGPEKESETESIEEEKESEENAEADSKTILTMTYDTTFDGMSVKPEYYINASMPDGSAVSYSDEDKYFYDTTGETIAYLEDAEGIVTLTIYNEESVFDIEVSAGEAWVVHTVSMEDMNVNIEYLNSQDIVYPITGDLNHLYKAPTGMWCYFFRIANGEVQTYNPMP